MYILKYSSEGFFSFYSDLCSSEDADILLDKIKNSLLTTLLNTDYKTSQELWQRDLRWVCLKQLARLDLVF